MSLSLAKNKHKCKYAAGKTKPATTNAMTITIIIKREDVFGDSPDYEVPGSSSLRNKT